MPIHIADLVSTVSIAADELPLAKEQRTTLYADFVRRGEHDALNREALSRVMQVPTQARPPIRFRK